MLFIAGSNLYAQVKYKTEFFTSEDGLSHRMVSSMLRDDEGFMWFGTWNGINRFDGHTFKSFKTGDRGIQRLHNDRVRQMVDDHKGFIWIVTYDRYVYCFDKRKEVFLPVSDIINKKAGKKITFHSVAAITQGKVWLKSEDNGVFALPVRGVTVDNIVHYSKNAPARYALENDFIFFLHKDADENIWICNGAGITRLVKSASGDYIKASVRTEGAGKKVFTKVSENATHIYFSSHTGEVGVYSKAKQLLTLTRLPGETIVSVLCSKFADLAYMTTQSGKLITLSLVNGGIHFSQQQAAHTLRNMFEDSKGNLWIETEDVGVAVYKREQAVFNYYTSNIVAKPKENNHFNAFEDFNGTVWISFSNGELCYFDAASNRMLPALPLEGFSGKAFMNSVYRVFYDNGIIWVGSEIKGVIKLIVQRNIFSLEDISASDHYLDHGVRAVLFDKAGRRWTSTQGGQLMVQKDGKEALLKFNGRPVNSYAIIAYALKEDSRGNIWIGTRNSGLYKAIPLNRECTSYQLQYYPTALNEKEGIRVYAIEEDGEGNIWIGTYDAGLFLIAEKKGRCFFRSVPVHLAKYPERTFEQVRHLTLGMDGALWAATTGGLLVIKRANAGTDKFHVKIYRKTAETNRGLGDNDVFYVCPDKKGGLWVATAGGGISYVTTTRQGRHRFKSFKRGDGLLSEYVMNCVEDRDGNVWMATEAALSCFEAKTQRIINYDSYDGLPTLGFSESACAIAPDGSLVFGTSHGLISFNPRQVQSTIKPSGMLLSSIQVNNTEAAPGTGDHIVEESSNYLRELKLKHFQNTIAINFTVPDHRRRLNQYSYRLTGLSNDWVKDVSGRAVFTDLPPGSYEFEVKGDGEDYDNRTYRKLLIMIAPPFWATWWAYIIYILLAIGIIEMVRRTLASMIRLRNKVIIEQQLSDIKMNFFTNISHELRTPLTLIVNPLEQLAKKEKFSKEGKSNLSVITKNADRMVHFINQLLDLRKIQSDKMTLNQSDVELLQLARDTAAHFEGIRAEKNIGFDIIVEDVPIYIRVDAEKIQTVLYNLLANAFKFTPAGKTVFLRLWNRPEQRETFIEVEDQGPGVASEQLSEIFELFHSGQVQDQRQAKGIGIGLALSKELVGLHGGEIVAQHNKWGGLTVKVILKEKTVSSTGGNDSDVLQKTAMGAAPVAVNEAAHLDAPEKNKHAKSRSQLLLVEDNDELRDFLGRQLGEFYQITEVTNGAQGYAAAKDLQPDLILSDVMMPEMNGIEMLDQLKNDINTSHIPVILLTAKSSVESQIEGLRYGADFYITKPFNSDFLLTAIQNLLLQRKRLVERLMQKSDPPAAQLNSEPVVTIKDEAFLKRVIQLVEEKMSDYDFNVESMAEGMNMGRTTFYKKFKSLTGQTPVEFIRDMRLDKAKEYLDAGEKNIADAAYDTGFNNPKYFGTCFKERFGVTPSDYLKNKG